MRWLACSILNLQRIEYDRNATTSERALLLGLKSTAYAEKTGLRPHTHVTYCYSIKNGEACEPSWSGAAAAAAAALATAAAIAASRASTSIMSAST